MARRLFSVVRRLLVPVLVVLACAGESTPAGTGPGTISGATDVDASSASASEGGASTGSDGATEDDDGADTTSSAATTNAPTTEGPSTDTVDDATDTAGVPGPVELYRGPVVGGGLPGWDPEAPRPLVLLGRQGDDWVATLAGIDENGGLFDNAAEEIVVWGWDDAPPLLYDGPVIGGAIPGWDPSDPFPVVMLAQLNGATSWYATLAQIGADGSLDQNAAERIIVWGWPDTPAGAPTPLYAGPVDGNAMLPGWDPDVPEPLVMLGKLPIIELWVSTLARISPDGTLSDNASTELRVWGW